MVRPPMTHIVLLDGTFASLSEGRRSNIGWIHRLVSEAPGLRRIHYYEGLQWEGMRKLPDIVVGRGMGTRIARAYGFLATAWQPGDSVFLFGYSRGAFATRSLAGMISRVGLLQPRYATERNIRLAWRYYRDGASPDLLARFRARRCHAGMSIDMLGVFDTVMALGVRLPVLWMLTEPRYRFHDHHLGPEIRRGVQALALDETRAAFQPILWAHDEPGRVTQMWFRGAHADIGGQLSGMEQARPLANIPLYWMLEQAEAAGLGLPADWRARLVCDRTAPSVGSWRNWGKAFLARAPRVAGRNADEALHDTVPRPYTGPALLVGHLADQAERPPRFRRIRPTGWRRI